MYNWKIIKFQIMQQSGNTSIVYQVAISMDNDTQGILFNVIRDDFEFPYHTKIFLSTFIVVILISQYVLQRRLFMFLRRPNRRFIDRIVDFQLSVNYFVVIFCMVWYIIFIWTETTKNYVSEVGCYLGVYALHFLPAYPGLHSFSISIFRYICILHPNKLSDQDLTPEVKKSKAVIF